MRTCLTIVVIRNSPETDLLKLKVRRYLSFCKKCSLGGTCLPVLPRSHYQNRVQKFLFRSCANACIESSKAWVLITVGKNVMQVSISSITIPPGTRLEGSKNPSPPGQSFCIKTLPSRQYRESKAPPPGHKVRKFHSVSINSDTIWNEKLCGLNKYTILQNIQISRKYEQKQISRNFLKC